MAELAKILQPVIDSLIQKDGVNKIIVLAHLQQLALEKELATLLKGVDVIIAGGSHTLLADGNDRLRPGDVAKEGYPLLTKGADGNNCLIVNTEANYRYVGRLVLSFDNEGNVLTNLLNSQINGAYATDSLGVAAVWNGNYSQAFGNGTKANLVKQITDALASVIANKDGKIFGKTSVYLEGRRGLVRTEETNLGNLTADANLWWARKFDKDVTISIKNGGGIRSAIGEVFAVGDSVALLPTAPNPLAGKKRGDISQLDIENSLRFNNRLWVVTTNASGIKTLLEHSLSATTAGATPGQFPQLGGARLSYDLTKAAGSRIQNLVILDTLGNASDTVILNGQLFGQASRQIKLVTLNFLAGGGDNYPFASVRIGDDLKLDEISNAPAGKATFAVPGSEQDAFAEYMVELYSQNPYSIADTKISQDKRLQQIQSRSDSVFDATTIWNGMAWNNGVPDDTKVAVISGNFNTTANGNITARRIRIAMGRTLALGNGGRIEAIESIQNMGIINNCASGSIVSDVYVGNAPVINTTQVPTGLASNVRLTPVFGNKLNLTWTNGNGQSRLVVLKAGSPVSSSAAQYGQVYTANADFGANGSALDGGKVVYMGTANSVEVSGLDPNTNYFAAVFEYNTDASCGPVYSNGVLSTAGVTGLEFSAFGGKVYPNPAQDLLNVQVEGSAQVSIMNLSGSILATYQIENEAVLSLNGFVKGLYLVEIQTQKGRAVQKLIIE
jgi:2',3'-cyclic-nucleotide 2'-phosphodiesterase (5'-nucleotidase family)